MIALRASYQLWFALRSYELPSDNTGFGGNHIITSAEHSHNCKLITKRSNSVANSILRDKSKLFAKEIVFLCRQLRENRIEGVLINQLLKSGTSVGANVHEAQYAQGSKDFISKFEIALKECNESEYWLELLYETNSINENEFKKFQSACIELRRMLVSSVTTLKSKG